MHACLVAGGRDRARVGVDQPQPTPDERGQLDADVVDTDDRVDRRSIVEREDRRHPRVDVRQGHDHGSVAHLVGHRLRMLGPDHHFDAEVGRRGDEIGRPVGGGGQQQKDARHAPIMARWPTRA